MDSRLHEEDIHPVLSTAAAAATTTTNRLVAYNMTLRVVMAMNHPKWCK